MLEYGSPEPWSRVDVVPAAQLERVEPERRGELVHRLLEHRHALDDARCAEGVLRAEARAHGEDHRAHVLAGVDREHRLRHREDPAAGAHVDHGRELDPRKRPVAARAERHRLPRPRAPAADDLLLVAPEGEADRPTGGAGELRGEERLGPRALLGAEGAADVLGDHAHLLRREVEAPRQLASGVEDPLRRDPGGERVALPAGDGGMRLERRLHVRRGLAGQLDAGVGPGERGIGVPADGLARVLGEPLLVQARLEVERCQRLEGGCECCEACRRGFGRVGRDHRNGCAGPCGLGRQRAVAVHGQRPFGPDHRAHPGRRSRGVEVEPGDATAGDRRAQDECMQHPGELDVDRVAGRAACSNRPVLAWRRRADDLQRGVVGPRLDLVLVVDQHPDVLEAPLHLALRLDEPRLHAVS